MQHFYYYEILNIPTIWLFEVRSSFLFIFLYRFTFVYT